MKQPATQSVRIAGWLVCVLLFCLAVHPPYCDLCDGFHVSLPSSSHPVAGHSVPVTLDDCNGVCMCCGFHWLPEMASLLPSSSEIRELFTPEPAPLPFTPASSPFRPPRTVSA